MILGNLFKAAQLVTGWSVNSVRAGFSGCCAPQRVSWAPSTVSAHVLGAQSVFVVWIRWGLSLHVVTPLLTFFPLQLLPGAPGLWLISTAHPSGFRNAQLLLSMA